MKRKNNITRKIWLILTVDFAVFILLVAILGYLFFIEPIPPQVNIGYTTDECYAGASKHIIFPATRPMGSLVKDNPDLIIKDAEIARIIGRSMKPAVFRDYYVINQDYNGEDLVIGDWIMYYDNETQDNVMHQVINVTEYGVRTQGINNEFPDQGIVKYEIIKKRIIGVMFRPRV